MPKSKNDEAASAENATPVVKTPHVGGAILAIIKEMAVEGVGKNRRNDTQKFNFRGIDDFHNALAPLFAREKVLVLPSYANRVATEYEYTKNGDKKRLVNVTIEGTYRIVSLVDGSEIVSGPFLGEAMDSGDKATNKAMSVSYKYFAIQTFSIPVVGSEDPDFESHEPDAKAGAKKQQPVADKQQQPPEDETVEQAINRLAKTKDGRKKLAAVAAQAYGVTIIDQIPADKTAEAIKRLEGYVEKSQKKAA